MLVEGLGIALPAAADAPAVTRPMWLRVPKAKDVARFYPKAASAAGVEGRAVLSCGVTAQGTLTQCSAGEETPVGYGFGAAALQMAGIFKMKTKAPDGRPVEGGRVRIPIRFILPLDTSDLTVDRQAAAGGVLRYYPEAASRAGLEGRAVISCAVMPDGRLTSCRVVSETPPGARFGEAALKMSVLFKAKPKRAAEGGVVVVPITFKLPR